MTFVIGVVERKQTLPILANVLVQAAGDTLIFITTDNQIEMSYIVEGVDLSHEFSFTVNARKLYDVAKVIVGNAMVCLSLEASTLKINGGQSEFALLTQPVNAFPRLRRAESATNVSLPILVVKSLCHKTFFSVSVQDFRTYLTGLSLKLEQNTLQAISSDGNRMSVAKQSLAGDADCSVDALLSRKTVNEIMKLPDVDAQFIFSDKQIEIVAENFVFCARLVDAVYPDYRLVLPKGEPVVFHVKQSALKEALVRVGVMSNDATGAVYFGFSKDQLRLQSCNREHETADETVLIDFDQGAIECVFKLDFVLDVLNAMPKSNLIKGEIFLDSKALLLSDAQDQQALYMLMTLKV